MSDEVGILVTLSAYAIVAWTFVLLDWLGQRRDRRRHNRIGF